MAMHDRATPTYAPWFEVAKSGELNKLVIDKIPEAGKGWRYKHPQVLD